MLTSLVISESCYHEPLAIEPSQEGLILNHICLKQQHIEITSSSKRTKTSSHATLHIHIQKSSVSQAQCLQSKTNIWPSLSLWWSRSAASGSWNADTRLRERERQDIVSPDPRQWSAGCCREIPHYNILTSLLSQVSLTGSPGISIQSRHLSSDIWLPIPFQSC